MYKYEGPRFKNRPVKVFWAGWESDTYRLGSQGWEISAEQDIMSMNMRLAIRHPKMDIVGITDIESYAYESLMRDMSPIALPTMLQFRTLGRQIMINTMGGSGFDFTPVDFRPQYLDSKIERLEDFANFTPIEIPTEQVYLREANMAEILKVAAERQESINGNMRKLNLDGVKIRNLHTELRIV